jgi:DUF438 domain-containing protein
MSELIDNRAHRIRTLKEIIKRLHAGEAPAQVKSQLLAIVRETDATEIAAMEQELIAEGVPVEEILSMCDLHSAVLRELIVERSEQTIAPGHPVETFRKENEVIGKTAAAMREAFARLTDAAETASTDPARLHECRRIFNDLMDIEKHYRRKENLLFSFLEKHGITGPSKVMWGKDDEVRELLKAVAEALAQDDATPAEWILVGEAVLAPALAAVEEMIYKEEKILLPMALDTLNDLEWGEIWSQSPEYGWCLIEPANDYRPPKTVAPGQPVEMPKGGALIFPTGALTFEQLRGLFAILPVDLTFVDADDCVRYFSEGVDRVFARSKAIIGRKVHHCHPPKSVHIVEKILSDFKSGERNVAEFWIEMHGKFVHIRYFAVRDDKGVYLGTLEVTQDLTRLRALTGERRLLEYD